MVSQIDPNSSDQKVAGRSAEQAIARLLEVMAKLRDPESGCPWDIEQDFASIAPYTIEEAYEVADAIERKAWKELEYELGDLLLQTVYHAEIGRELGLFCFASIADLIADKMVKRHPHVFAGDGEVHSAADQTLAWEVQKASERAAGQIKGALSGIPLALPSLLRAFKIQKRAARVGFDWMNASQVLEKVEEEARELAMATQEGNVVRIQEEFGDLLFSVVNLARHLDIDPEASLRAATCKFVQRFEEVERRIENRGKTVEDASVAELDALWNEAKRDDS